MNYIRQGAWGILVNSRDDPRLIVPALHLDLQQYDLSYWHDYRGSFVLWDRKRHLILRGFPTLSALCFYAISVITPSDKDSASPQ